MEVGNSSQAPSGAGGDAAKVASLEEQMKTLQDHVEYLLSRNVNAEKETDRLRKELHGRDRGLNAIKAQKFEALAQVSELQTQLHQRDDEVKNLKTDVDVLGNQLAEASRAKNNALLKLDNLASREESFEYRKRMMEQETELLRGQIHHLEQRVVQQEAELVDATSTSRVVQLESQLQRMTDELAARDQVANRLRGHLKEEQEKIKKLEEKLSQARENDMRSNLIHSKEMEAQKRVLAFAEEKQKESEAQAENYLAKMKEIQSELEIKSIPGDAERKALNEIHRLEALLSEKEVLAKQLESQVHSLSVELDAIKKESLDQYVEKLFPSASLVGQNLRGDLTLTQIYQKYVSAMERLSATKLERDTLKIRNDGLTVEVSDLETHLSSVKSALEIAESKVQQMNTENNRQRLELEEAKVLVREKTRSAGQHIIDKERLQQQNDDLRKQVVQLLKEIASVKSGGLETYSGNEPLIGLGSIEEMQHKNIELISLVRELQIKAYNAEMALEKMEKVADCNEKLEELIDQVKRYQERELVQSDMMKLVIKQRDHFEETAKVALQRAEEKMAEMEKELQERAKSHTTSSQPASEAMVVSPRNPSPVIRQPVYQQRSPTPRPGSPGGQRMQRPPQGSPRFAPYPTPPGSKQFVDALHARLKKCQEELDSTSQSFADYRSNTKNNMDMVVTQLEEMRTTLMDAKLENANLRATCHSNTDKLNSLKSIMEGQQKQLESINKMRTLQDSIITKHEKSVVELNKEIIHTYAKLSNCECMLERAEAEKRRMRVSESAAKKECDMLRASMASQNLVYLGCQELKASRERADAEDSLHLSSQLEAVQADNKELKHQLETSQVHLQDQVNHLQACLNRERAVLEGAIAEKAASMADCTRAQELLAQAQRDVLVLRTNKNPTTTAESQTDAEIDLTDKVAQLEELLQKATQSERAANADVQDVTSRLASAMDALAQTQKMLTEMQQKMRTAEETSETEKALAKQKTEMLESDLSVAREQLMVTREQLGRAEKQMENLRSDSMRASKNQAVAGAENHESVRSELAAIKEELVRAKEMLEREKEQHKLDLQALSYTRKQVVSQERAQAENKMKISALENELARITKEMESAQNVAAVVKGEDSQLVQELRQHNEILLDQLQRGGGGGQSELHKVIKCLRREKDMAQSKSDVFETKAANLELQLRSLESKCSELEDLCDQRRASEASQTLMSIPQAKYDELQQQSEMLNALTDSSIIQRETNVALTAELNELRPKLKSVLDELESLKSRNNLFQEKIVSEEENVTELNNKIREFTSKITLAEERIVELETQLNSSQSQLSSNTESLRTKLNVQNQELLKKNFEVRKLNSEKENLLKQSITDKESLAKVSVELTKEKAALVEANAQLQQLKSSLAEAQKEAAKIAELNESLQQAKDALTKKDADMAVITAREIKVRTIAKKYKLQYDQAVAESKDKQSSDEKAKQLETSLAQTQTQLAEAQTKLMETEAEVQRLQESVVESNKKIEEQSATLAKEQATNAERQTRMKAVISTVRNRMQELSDQNSTLKTELAEMRNRASEIQALPEGTLSAEGGSDSDEVSQLKKELAELKALIEQSKQSSLASSSTPGTSGTTPAVKIRPLAAQARQVKPQVAQSATVIPTTRAAPTARLRPMVNSPRNVAVLAPSPQEVPSTSVTPIRVRTREDSNESALEESAPNVLLVRPNEVHPQPSTSSASASTSATPGGGRPPLLKRPRLPDSEQQEPQAKQVCATVPSEEVEQVVAEEDSSTEAIVEEEQNVESEAADEDAIDEELEQMALQAVEDNEDADEPLAEDPQLQVEPAADVEEVLEAEQQQQVVAEVERIEAAAAPVNFMLPLMQQGFERFEEVGDFGIVPSTPTLYLPQRQSGFGEVVSSPHVPQSRHFTFTTEPAFAAQLAANVAASHDQDEATSGHMVPGTPLSSSPNENQQSERAESSSEESNQQVASSSNNDFVAPVMAQEPSTGSLPVPRGMLSARRNAEVSRISRPTPTRPAPIVWNRNDTPERGAMRGSGIGRTRGRGRARSNPLRRGRL